jgi:hypothetical protein
VTAELHLAEDALTLHLLLQDAKRLINVVVPNQNLHAKSSCCAVCAMEKRSRRRDNAHLKSGRGGYQNTPLLSRLVRSKSLDPPS